MVSRPLRQYVTFDLMGEEYALQIQNVREIIEFEPVTTVPSMPPVVRGVMNLRGNVVPVIDLPVKFGIAPTVLGAGAYIVVVDLVWSNEGVRLGLVTRELGRVIDVTDDQIKPVPDFGTRIQSEYLRGVGQIDGRMILFLNVERLLSPNELLRITAVNAQPAAPLAGAVPHAEGRRDGAGEA
jgi:purine-binding chemotaxis protein CheW